jgi:Domain of unknown function (DUF4351)
MHEYDIALKLLLQASAGSVLRQVTGGLNVARWLNVELPQVQTRRADLLGATIGDRLIHIELQSSHDADMALRMAEYALGIYRQFRKFPTQVVLYVGEPPLRMTASLTGPDATHPAFAFRYALFDFRDLNGTALLESIHIEDNILAILTRLQDRARAIRQILGRIANLKEPERHAALTQFLIISGLRRLGRAIQEEAKTMPILNSILDHDLLGPTLLQGRQEIVRLLLEKRFGLIPPWVEDRLASLSAPELDDVAVRLLDVAHLEDLFPQQ